MEFEELQKIWDQQNNKPLYAFDENALYNRILSKKKQGHYITNATEWLIIVSNIAAGLLVGVNIEDGSNIYMYLFTAWMFVSALFVVVSRIQRIKGDQRFDRSLRGDLSHAVAVARYQVRLSMIMRWNTLPVGILTILAVWETGRSFWMAAGILTFFAIIYYASGLEHNFYKRRKKELEILQEKLDDEIS
jgi:uncharacterized membrane protein HdeD (DUF308 family)